MIERARRSHFQARLSNARAVLIGKISTSYWPCVAPSLSRLTPPDEADHVLVDMRTRDSPSPSYLGLLGDSTLTRHTPAGWM
jgi:hypothetical protein